VLRTKSVDCRWCATIFMPVRSDQIFCSSLCGSRHAAEVLRLANGPLYCHDCGDELGKKKADRKYCANCISARRRIASSSRRAAIRNLFVEPVDLRLIAERDKWCCQLCGKRVRKTCLWPDPLSPSLDHVIPIFHGGEHSRANTQLAHLICNQRKHVTTRTPQQLALIG
jgi:5-methylcytosine-specific restriction endonuclease McrA